MRLLHLKEHPHIVTRQIRAYLYFADEVPLVWHRWSSESGDLGADPHFQIEASITILKALKLQRRLIQLLRRTQDRNHEGFTSFFSSATDATSNPIASK
jgi:hypothetical protein